MCWFDFCRQGGPVVWAAPDVLSYDGPDLFSPRRLGAHLSELLREGPPPEPRELGTHD